MNLNTNLIKIGEYHYHQDKYGNLEPASQVNPPIDPVTDKASIAHEEKNTTLVRDGNNIFRVDVATGEITSRIVSSESFHNGTNNLITKAQLEEAERFIKSGNPKQKKATGRPKTKIHNPHWREIFQFKQRFPSEFDLIVEGLAKNTAQMKNGNRINFNMSDLKRVATCEWITADLGFGSERANRYLVAAAEALIPLIAERCRQAWEFRQPKEKGRSYFDLGEGLFNPTQIENT